MVKERGYGMNEQEVNKYIDELLEMDKEALIKRIVRHEYKAEQPAEKEREAMDEFKRASLKFKNI